MIKFNQMDYNKYGCNNIVEYLANGCIFAVGMDESANSSIDQHTNTLRSIDYKHVCLDD